MRGSALGLPLVAQSLDHTCGAACFESLHRHWISDSPGELHFAEKLGTLELGYTAIERIADLARSHGWQAHVLENATIEDLHREFEQGAVLFVTWWDEDAGHYSLVEAIDNASITLMDPWLAREGQYNTLELDYFVTMWRQRGAKIIPVFRASS